MERVVGVTKVRLPLLMLEARGSMTFTERAGTIDLPYITSYKTRDLRVWLMNITSIIGCNQPGEGA